MTGTTNIDSLLEKLAAHVENGGLISGMDLNEFQDEDLNKYPAIEIGEMDLSADECEIIASRIMDEIAGLKGPTSTSRDKDVLVRKLFSDTKDLPVFDPILLPSEIPLDAGFRRTEPSLGSDSSMESMIKVARGLSILAYNSLMDPKQTRADHRPEPFFHRHKLRDFNENWLQIAGKSEFDLKKEFPVIKLSLSSPFFDEDERPAFELTDRQASDYERKASIGAWAFYHLRMLGSERGSIWTVSSTRNFLRDFEQIYNFRNSYKFPEFPLSAWTRLNEVIKDNKPGELLFLLYRSMIILENKFSDRRFNAQKQMLMKLVFGGPTGLHESGLWLWTWTRSAARALGIPIERLIDDLDWALDDPRWTRYSTWSKNNVANLREFHDKYIKSTYNSQPRSKYFKYARAVNYRHFHSLSTKGNRELKYALMMIVETKSGRSLNGKPMREPWREWGSLLGAKICEKYIGRASSSSDRPTDRDGFM